MIFICRRLLQQLAHLVLPIFLLGQALEIELLQWRWWLDWWVSALPWVTRSFLFTLLFPNRRLPLVDEIWLKVTYDILYLMLSSVYTVLDLPKEIKYFVLNQPKEIKYVVLRYLTFTFYLFSWPYLFIFLNFLCLPQNNDNRSLVDVKPKIADETLDKSRIWKMTEINEPSQCRSLRLPDNLTATRVLIYLFSSLFLGIFNVYTFCF